jgi:hypothetical protein
MNKNATKYNKTQSKWCIKKHGTSKIIDTFETYQHPPFLVFGMLVPGLEESLRQPALVHVRAGGHAWVARAVLVVLEAALACCISSMRSML